MWNSTNMRAALTPLAGEVAVASSQAFEQAVGFHLTTVIAELVRLWASEARPKVVRRIAIH